MTGCRFVQVADSYTCSFQACTSFTMPIKKKLITRSIKQATMSIIYSARARVSCRFQSMQTIIFDYQCDSVSSMVVKFRNHEAAFQHSLPISITDGEKIILLYVTFTYISSQCHKCLQISILWAETGSLGILFNSITFKIVYGNFYQQLQETIDQTPKEDILVVQGDWNAKVGKDAQADWGEVCGSYCNVETNGRGLRLLEFATFNNLVLTNTLGPHKPSRRWTWHSPDGKHYNQIDYILVKKRFRSGVYIHRTRSFPGAHIGSDHDLVMMTF